MSDKKAVLVSIGVLNPEAVADLKTYEEGARPLLMAAGARVIGGWRFVDRLVGDRQVDSLFLAEFPNAQAIRDVWASEAYKALVPARDRAFSTLDQFIVE